VSSKRQLRATLNSLRESHRQYAGWYGVESVQASRVARMIERTEAKLKEL